MATRRVILAACVLAMTPLAAQAQTEGYWLIKQVVGRWEYRDATHPARRLAGKYEALLTSGEVRCLEASARSCELRYLADARSSATRKLPIPVAQSGAWVRLRNLPAPPPAVLPVTSSGLMQKFTTFTRPGGSRAASACSGEFPLRAPACGETVDVSDFSVRWQPPPADRATEKVAVLVERVDGSAARHRVQLSASIGEYADARLTEFIRRLQEPNESVDIVVTVQADGGRSAMRLVHVPPSVRSDQFESEVKQVVSPDPVVRGIAIVSLALDGGMWSRAAKEAARLIDVTAASPSLLEYALAGLCQSDFEEEKGRIRKLMPETEYKRVCAASPVLLNAPPASVPPSAASPAAGAAADAVVPGKSRPGIALLIGNWEYWNQPLNSVQNDLDAMKQALESVGFAVTVRENLKGPQQFTDALEDALKEHKAVSDDVLLVYYSGHGVQIDGKAYLLGTGVPTAARVVEDTRENAQSAERLLALMERAIPGTRILMVEACRDAFGSVSASATGRASKGGFAFEQDDVPNTFVMFANKPGLPTPARSDYGLGGPFTESFVHAIYNSSGEIQDVYRIAAEKTREMSPGQEPDEHHSRAVEPVYLRPRDVATQDKRAKDLLNGAEKLYRARAWDEFVAAVDRARVIASDQTLQQRLAREVEFGNLVKQAEDSQASRRWAEAAGRWQKASAIFPVRGWTSMRAAVASLLAGEIPSAVRLLALVATRTGDEAAPRASQLLADLLKSFPALEAEARKAAQDAASKIQGAEFEPIKHQEE